MESKGRPGFFGPWQQAEGLVAKFNGLDDDWLVVLKNGGNSDIFWNVHPASYVRKYQRVVKKWNNIWVVVSNIYYFHPEIWGRWTNPILTSIFLPPTRFFWKSACQVTVGFWKRWDFFLFFFCNPRAEGKIPEPRSYFKGLRSDIAKVCQTRCQKLCQIRCQKLCQESSGHGSYKRTKNNGTCRVTGLVAEGVCTMNMRCVYPDFYV